MTIKDIVYVLKRCIEGNKAHNSFEYPQKGTVEAKDWVENNNCGFGLHGWTLGFEKYFNGELSGNFIVLEVNKKDGYVELGDKVKFKKGKVILNTPDAQEAHNFMLSKYPEMKLHWSTANQGDESTANQGDESTANQGDRSTANQVDRSTANQGYSSTANQGDRSTANQAYWSTTNQGYSSTANQGNRSTANQGDSSTANQGDRSTANQGDRSTANQGDSSVSVHRYVTNRSSIIKFAKNSVGILYTNNGIPHIYSKYQNETVYFFDGKPKKVYKHTKDNIKKLEEWEVFVFGSNMNGRHAGGSAKLAQDKFGAENGNGEGLQGKSYAFPTLNKEMQKCTQEELKESVNKLIKCATENTTKVFLLTKVGTGIAGFSEEEMKEFFNRNDIPANIIKPKDW